MQIEVAERRLGLLVQFIQNRDVAPQRLLVAVEFDADAVDLRGHVAELFGEPPQAQFHRREQASEEAAVLERGGIETARLGQDVRQQFACGPELPVLGLGEDPVGELDDRTLRAIAEGHDARPVGDVDLRLIRVTAVASTMTAGTLMVSLIALLLLKNSPRGATWCRGEAPAR